MDYTLVHYNSERWERRAYQYVKQALLDDGWPVQDLQFEPRLVSLGLVIDLEQGNLVKVNRFGHVRRACHGTRMLDYNEWQSLYGTAPVELSAPRWRAMDTLFTLSEACLFVQMVELLDAGKLVKGLSYRNLYERVRVALDATHLEGRLKAEIVADPEQYVMIDEELPQLLMDWKAAGKQLLLITNSEWQYTESMMSYAFDRLLPNSCWKELFDIVIVQARKPSFFSERAPAFRLVDPKGLFEPHVGALHTGQVYLGGNARQVESSLGLNGDRILYIGDHIFADVHVSKDLLRWRTALVLRELEQEMIELLAFRKQQLQLDKLMAKKEELEHQFSLRRLGIQRGASQAEEVAMREQMRALRAKLVKLDEQIVPHVQEAGQLLSKRWGPLMRCGNDKSHLARQIERYADVYMSRVSNLLAYTPFFYLRAPRGSLPHDAFL